MLIYYRKSGRLANRLWASAYLIAHAEHHGYELWNPAFTDYTDLFESTRQDALCRYPLEPSGRRSAAWRKFAYRSLRLLGEFAYSARIRRGPGFAVVDVKEAHDKTGVIFDLDDPKFVDLAKHRRLLFAGWLFRTEHLQAHADVVRKYFVPAADRREKIVCAVQRARETCDLLIGVHIRGGDYRTWHGGRFFYSAQQYAGFMRQAAALHPGKRVGFLICSDEPRTEEEFPGLDVTLSQDGPLEDLYRMAACDLLISSYSTFSQWSSFYGQVPLAMVYEPDRDLKIDDFQVARDCEPGP